MIDLHCHILPGVDDGAPNPDVALDMADIAKRNGTDLIVATPHCNTRDGRGNFDNFRVPAMDAAFAALQAAVTRAGIALRVLPGCELLLRGDVGALLDARAVYTLGGTRYLLVEFYFDEHPAAMDAALATVAAHGYVPVVAHPERYFCVQDLPEMAERWAAQGYVLQLNKGSILGDLGEGAYDTARGFLRRELCHVIASDAHHYGYRTPSFARLLDELEYFFPALDPLLYLQHNPARILADRAL